jgi:hypothetical protein
MTLASRFFRWHRWIGYVVALQVLAWMLGGVLFAWLPFQGWVKSADAVAKPGLALPADWAAVLAAELAGQPPPLAVQAVATASGPAWRLRHAAGDQWRSARGGELPAPDAAAVERFAASLYKGDGRLQAVQRLAESPLRLGIVREAGERRDLWLARFDDRLQTRLYVDGRSGELLAVRNEAWVVYDFFFRLHVMDYQGGDDFNNPLLRAAATVALGLVLTGLVLLGLGLRRRWRRRGVRGA